MPHSLGTILHIERFLRPLPPPPGLCSGRLNFGGLELAANFFLRVDDRRTAAASIKSSVIKGVGMPKNSNAQANANVIEIGSRLQEKKRAHPHLPDHIDQRLGALAAEELRAVIHREIEQGSMRWARNGKLLPMGAVPERTDSAVFSASESCARTALQEAIRAVFWQCGEPVPSADMPLRIVRLHEELNEGLRQVLKDIGYDE